MESRVVPIRGARGPADPPCQSGVVQGWTETCDGKSEERYALAHSLAQRVLHTCRQELAIALRVYYFLRSISTDSRLCSLPSGAPGVLSLRAGSMTSKHSSYATGWHSAINHIVYERNLLVLSTCDGTDAGFTKKTSRYTCHLLTS